MRLDDNARFAHPVLRPDSDDFVDGRLKFLTEVEERPRSGFLRLNYEFEIQHDGIEHLVQSGRAKAGIFVSCLPTFFNRFFDLVQGSGTVDVDEGCTSGLVRIRPVVVTTEEIKDFFHPTVHAEFGNGPHFFPAAYPVAIWNEIRISVGLDKLAPMESIFHLARNDELDEGTIAVDLESSSVVIQAGGRLYDTLNTFRQFSQTKVILFNSVYLVAIMQILEALSADEALHAEKRWYRVFRAKCDHNGIILEGGDLLENAQRLLDQPMQRFVQIQEELTE